MIKILLAVLSLILFTSCNPHKSEYTLSITYRDRHTDTVTVGSSSLPYMGYYVPKYSIEPSTTLYINNDVSDVIAQNIKYFKILKIKKW